VSATPPFDLDAGWRLHPQVALRPEPFGALLYHFGTRKLSFLKDRTVVGLVRSLPDHPNARSALRAAGVEGSGAHRKALAVLAGSHMLVRAT
jgi:mycofactocin biosynthesis protein MftB